MSSSSLPLLATCCEAWLLDEAAAWVVALAVAVAKVDPTCWPPAETFCESSAREPEAPTLELMPPMAA